MNRIKIIEDGYHQGAWFDKDSATQFEGESYWNGSNRIQKSTHDQWTGQNLYYTKSGKWVLACWINWQGATNTYELISEEEACLWFIKNEYSDEQIHDLPEKIRENILQHIASQEL